MQIGFDAKRAFNNNTGLGNYSRFVIQSLMKYAPGNHLKLFTPFINEAYEGYLKGEDSVEIIRPTGFIGRNAPAIWRTFNLADEIQKSGLDVFHGLSNELPVGIEKFKVKKVVTIHDLIFLRYPDYYNNIDRFIYTRKFKNACQSADVVIATSDQTKQDIVTFFHTDEQKIKVVYQSCDEQFTQIAEENEREKIRRKYALSKPYIICVGTIEERKNQLTVLKAFHQSGITEINLVFVGRQKDYAASLHAFIKENRLSDKVQFLTLDKFEDLPALYQAALFSVYASEYEGFGIPVLESLCSHIPAVVAQSSSLIEVGGEAAVYFKPNNTEHLADIFMQLYMDENLRRQLVLKGEEQILKFDPAILTDQLIYCYK